MTTPIESGLRDALSGQYELEREIGRGGMGVVYLARDVRLDRAVAIKALPPDLSGNAELHERFLREARTAARLSHTHIVPIYRADEIDGRAFFVMAYVDGMSLGERLRKSTSDVDATPPIADVVRWLSEVALALGYAHSHDVVHRDIKPENILIDGATGSALVADFGIARVTAASRLTSTGQVLGSVHFMSPEQVMNESLDGRSDLYSLGAVAFLALSGKLPFPSEAAGAVLVAHVTTTPPSLQSVAPHAPAALAAVVDRCLLKDPAERYQTGEELAHALNAAMRNSAEITTGRTPRGEPAYVNKGGMPDVDDATVISEDDAARLWKRAAELQADAARRGVVSGDPATGSVPLLPRRLAPDGYRLRDASAAAVEAGISQAYVALALSELRGKAAQRASVAPVVTSPGQSQSVFAGAPIRLEREIVIEGEVTAESFELLVDTIQRSLGDIGHVSTVGRSLLWSTQGKGRKLHVNVQPRNGHTTIRVTERLTETAGGLFGGIMGGVGGGLGSSSAVMSITALHSVPLGIGLGAGVVAGSYLLARTIFANVSRYRSREIDRLVAALASQVEVLVRD